MTKPVARHLYGALLRLHPKCFRACFAGEMLHVFDEACEQYGAGWLLGEAVISLLRQWLLRSPEDARPAGSHARFGLLAGSYPDAGPPHLTTAKLSLALLLTLSSVFLFPYPVSFSQRVVATRAHVRMEASYAERRHLQVRPIR